MASLIPNGKQQYFDNAGVPLSAGKLYTWVAGTVNVPKATFADADGLIPNPNPIILNPRGEALIYWAGSYAVTLTDSLGNPIYTVDDVTETNLGYRTSSNGSMITPSGSTAQRDSVPVSGYIRYNTDLQCLEGYYVNAWVSIVRKVNGSPVPDGGDIAVQVPLVSGTTIKTLGGVSLLGSGDIPTPTSVAANLYLNASYGGF